MTPRKKNDDALRGALEIAAEVGETEERKAYRLCEKLLREGVITKIGRQYFGSRSRVRERLAGNIAS